MSEKKPDIPNFPSGEEMARLEAAMKAKAAVRQSGGDPAALDALAMVRSIKVEGVLLFSNPPATYSALQLIKAFFPPAGEGEDKELVAQDQLVAMSYAFAEPVPAYLLARQGEEAYLTAAMGWAGQHFSGADASYRLGRVAGWCAGVLAMLDDGAGGGKQDPAVTTNQPQATAPAVPLPGRTRGSFLLWWTGLWRSITRRGKAPSAPSPWRPPSPSGPPASSGAEGNPVDPARR